MKKRFVFFIIILIIVGGLTILYFIGRGGFTAKAQYEKCVETCEEMMTLESSKQYCGSRCTEVTGYSPSGEEVETQEEPKAEEMPDITEEEESSDDIIEEDSEDIEETEEATASDKQKEGKEYYCEWVWPQKIIDRDTKEVIKACTSERPWCNYADYSYEKVGCCKDKEHTDCVTLPNL